MWSKRTPTFVPPHRTAALRSIGQIHGEGHHHPTLSDPLEAVLAMAWMMKWPPHWIMSMPNTMWQMWASYVEGRAKGEAIRARR